MSRWITIEAAELAVKALEEENARLKAEVKKFKLTLKQDRQISRKDLNDLRFEKDKAQQSLENAKAEIVRLRSFTTRTIIPNEQLQAQVERLTKAGDAIYQSFDQFGQVDAITLKRWQTAKDGKDVQ